MRSKQLHLYTGTHFKEDPEIDRTARALLPPLWIAARDKIKTLGPHKGLIANVVWGYVGDCSAFPKRKHLEAYLLKVKRRGLGYSLEMRWAMQLICLSRLARKLYKGMPFKESRNLFNRCKKQFIREYFDFWKRKREEIKDEENRTEDGE